MKDRSKIRNFATYCAHAKLAAAIAARRYVALPVTLASLTRNRTGITDDVVDGSAVDTVARSGTGAASCGGLWANVVVTW
jgi:hypothetical protein